VAWADAVIYQIYPRSFQDSNGDGIGDLPGIAARLDHIASLGVEAVWLSPIYRSPQADFGYDVADYEQVDPSFGTLADFDRLLAETHRRGLKLLMDLIPCHTSIEHRWFRERPDFYVWADAPPNNWLATFGGPAWTRDPRTARYYLHSFFPEQPDLDWRNPDVVVAMQDVLRFWLKRRVDGFRLDALDRLMKDPELRDDPPADGTMTLPLTGDYATLAHVHSANAPDIGTALAALRAAAGDAFLVGEVYLPTALLAPYLESLDVAFCFELYHAGTDAGGIRPAVAAACETGKAAWVLSNHDFPRLASRVGLANARVASMLVLTLPGPAFLYQGDELGLADGPGHDPPLDRAGRDPYRHPMPWDASPRGGFTDGEPWLAVSDPAGRNVADQEADPGSQLWLTRDLIALRCRLGDGLRFRDAAPDTLVYERGDHLVALNLGDEPRPAPRAGEVVLESAEGAARERGTLPPHAGWIARRVH
jgi:alpha-glucosidase